MPSAGDRDNLGPNLTTLAQLQGREGAKLSYDRDSGRFSVQEAGKLQSLARTFSRDSIENEEYFGTPIRELFAAAHAENHLGSPAALDGLRALRGSYTGDKRRILDAVIEDARLGVKKERARGTRLRERYAKYVTFGFAQEMFLPQSSAGVCYSLTVHWARRILMGKTYFGISENTEVRLATLNSAQKERIMRKVDHIRPLHAELAGWEGQFGEKLMMLARPVVGERGEVRPSRFAKYSNVFVEILTTEPQPIRADAPGRQVMKAVYRAALVVAKEPRQRQYRIFTVNFSKGEQGHTIGIHLGDGLHFFDPNCGEFNFPEGSAIDMSSFFDDWWQAFYMVRGRAGFDQWSLEGVRQRG